MPAEAAGALAEIAAELDELAELHALAGAEHPRGCTRDAAGRQLIKPGYHGELDELVTILTDGKEPDPRPGGRERETHRHRQPQDRLQQGLRLLSGGQQGPAGQRARLLHPQTDPGQCRTVHHPGTQGVRGKGRRRPGKAAGPGVPALHRNPQTGWPPKAPAFSRPPPSSAELDFFCCLAEVGPPPSVTSGRRWTTERDQHRGGPPSGDRTGAAGRPLRAQRCATWTRRPARC